MGTIVVESKGNGLNARHDPPCQTGYVPPCLQHLSTACLYGSVCNLVLAQSSCPDACSKRVGNGHCHAECYTAGCEWDGGDCEDLPNLPPICAERCPPKLLNNRECDEECNVEACMFDGNDCDHGHTECYKDPHGKDYRGSINTTKLRAASGGIIIAEIQPLCRNPMARPMVASPWMAIDLGAGENETISTTLGRTGATATCKSQVRFVGTRASAVRSITRSRSSPTRPLRRL